MKRFLGLLALAPICLLLAGCTSTLTNLTPRQQTRNANGLYPVEVIWESKQGNLVKESLKGYVIIGQDAYPMQRSPMMTNRWEAVIPIQNDKDVVNYRYKFDYEYLTIPVRKPSSRLSAPYQLEIQDR